MQVFGSHVCLALKRQRLSQGKNYLKCKNKAKLSKSSATYPLPFLIAGHLSG